MKVKTLTVTSKTTLTKNYNSFSSESQIVVDEIIEGTDLAELHEKYSQFLNSMNKNSIQNQIKSFSEDINK